MCGAVSPILMYWEVISEEKLIQPCSEDNLKDIEQWGRHMNTIWEYKQNWDKCKNIIWICILYSLRIKSFLDLQIQFQYKFCFLNFKIWMFLFQSENHIQYACNNELQLIMLKYLSLAWGHLKYKSDVHSFTVALWD